MTERNFTTVVPGWYRTRDGELAKVVQIMSARFPEGYPARGFIGTRQRQHTWTMDGSLGYGCESPEDLTEYLAVNVRVARLLAAIKSRCTK